MALMKCNKCGIEMSYNDAKCPNCNSNNTNPNAITPINALISLAFVAIVGVYFLGDKKEKAPEQDNSKTIADSPAIEAGAVNISASDKEIISNNLKNLAKTLQENAEKKTFLKEFGAKSIQIEADAKNISSSNFGTIDITIITKDENIDNIGKAKMLVNVIIDQYKTDTQQDVIFKISAKLFSDTKIEQIKHYYSRVKYIPQISPTVEVDEKDMLVNLNS